MAMVIYCQKSWKANTLLLVQIQGKDGKNALYFSCLLLQKSYSQVTWKSIKYWDVIENVLALWVYGVPVQIHCP